MLLLNNAIELLFFYEVAYRQTEPLQEVLSDLKTENANLVEANEKPGPRVLFLVFSG